MRTLYSREKDPEDYRWSIFLVGPSPRHPEVPSWRPEMLSLLKEAGFEGMVFVPEDRDKITLFEYGEQVEWEHHCIQKSDLILTWVPRDLLTMPAFTTNVEFGMHVRSGKLRYGAPPNCPKNRYLDYCYRKFLGLDPAMTMRQLVKVAVEYFIGKGPEYLQAFTNHNFDPAEPEA